MQNGEYKVAQYGQWDGYPTGQGEEIVKFLKKNFEKESFLKNLNSTKVLSDEEVSNLWKLMGADDSGMVSMDISDKFKVKYPQLSRDCGAEILDHIQKNPHLLIHHTLDFAADSLFCEYAYVVNLDTDKLEVYEGFNKSPLDENERFFFLMEKSNPRTFKPDDERYYPVKHRKTYSFEELVLGGTMKELEEAMYEERQ